MVLTVQATSSSESLLPLEHWMRPILHSRKRTPAGQALSRTLVSSWLLHEFRAYMSMRMMLANYPLGLPVRVYDPSTPEQRVVVYDPAKIPDTAMRMGTAQLASGNVRLQDTQLADAPDPLQFLRYTVDRLDDDTTALIRDASERRILIGQQPMTNELRHILSPIFETEAIMERSVNGAFELRMHVKVNTVRYSCPKGFAGIV